KVLESEKSHKFPSTQHFLKSPDKNGTSLVGVGLAPATAKPSKHNVDTSHFHKENRAVFSKCLD
ncbi:hypothetical protein NDU88_003469, partial [Pleurodeles waltl]